jgi:hypothetical protein
MGNRASILFFDQNIVSPTVYLHWHGSNVPNWIDQLRQRMQGRFNDASYAAARFVGLCHEQIDGQLSLGILSNQLTLGSLKDRSLLESLSPGNAGLVVVDTRDFTWTAYAGDLAEFNGRAKP